MGFAMFLSVVTIWLFAEGGELDPKGRYRTWPVLIKIPLKAFVTCDADRAVFHILTSSTSPVKKFVAGVTLELAPTLTGFVPIDSGEAPAVALLPACTPSTYNITLVPSFVTTA